MSQNDARLMSLAHLTLYDTSPPDLVAAAAESGFNAVGIRLGRGSQPTDPTWPMLGDTPMLRETQRRLSDTGLRVLEVEGVSILPERRLETFKQLPALLESAATLGAQFLTVAGFDSNAANTAEQLAALCDLCAPYDLRPVVEFIPRSAVPSLEHARKLIEEPGCKGSAILLDVLHFARSGGTAADLLTVDQTRIGLVQLCDAPLAPPDDEDLRRAESRNRCLPGDGELPLAALLSHLPAHMPISVEAPSTRYAACSPGERAALAMLATRRVLDA